MLRQRKTGDVHYNLRSLDQNDRTIRRKRKRRNPWSRKCQKRNKVLQQENILSRLPYDVLNQITKDLSLPDFLSIRSVCHEWRLFFAAARPVYLAKSPPLALSWKFQGKKTMYFKDMIKGDLYSTMFVYFAKKLFGGTSCGFIILEDSNSIGFANPVSSQHLEFPKPVDQTMGFTKRIVLSKLVPSGDFVAVVLDTETETIWASVLGSEKWTHCEYRDSLGQVIDLAVIDGRVLALTNNGCIGLVSCFSSQLALATYELETKAFKENARLVASVTEHPMVVEPQTGGGVRIYGIDSARKEWVAVTNLGNQSVFSDDRNNYTISDPRGWGGLTNSIYHLNGNRDTCSVYSVSNGSMIKENRVKRVASSYMRSWYFPHMAHSVGHVLNDESAQADQVIQSLAHIFLTVTQ